MRASFRYGKAAPRRETPARLRGVSRNLPADALY